MLLHRRLCIAHDALDGSVHSNDRDLIWAKVHLDIMEEDDDSEPFKALILVKMKIRNLNI